MVSCLFLAGVVGLISVILLPVLLFCALAIIGFGRDGIKSGSCAAGCMSCGRGETPCCVSTGQSIGASGVFPCGCVLLLGLVPALITAIVCYSGSRDGNICLMDVFEHHSFNSTDC